MAAAAVMTTSPSSLVIGDSLPAVVGTESTALPKPDSTNSRVRTDDFDEINCNEHESQHGGPLKEGLKPSHKPTEFSDTTKKPPRMSSADDYTMLPEGYVPKDEDVICSWARQNHSHPGNEKFRLMINKYAPMYLNVSTKYQKSEVIAKIVAEVRRKSPGGGFVKKDFYSNRWFEVGDEKARDKVGHAIRKAAVGLGKKLREGKRRSQSLAKRRIKNSLGDLNQMNAMDMNMNMNMNMNPTSLLNKAALLNNGMSLDTGLSGVPNDMNFSAMNINVGSLNNLGGRDPISGRSNTVNASGVIGSMGMNGVGIGMNSISQGSYSRELEEVLMMNRLRTDLASSGGAATADSSRLGNIYGNINSSGDSMSFSRVHARIGMDDSAIMEELQRRRLRMSVSAKKEDTINMSPDSNQMSLWTEKNSNHRNQHSNNLNRDLNMNSSGLNRMNGSSNGRSNQAISMGMVALGGSQGNFEKTNSNNFDSMSTNVLLSQLAAENRNFMQGASNFGNNNSRGHSTMNVSNNQGSFNNTMGIMDDKFSNFMGGAGQQSLDPFNYNKR